MALSACIEWLFAAEHPNFPDRIRAARDAGLEGVEFHLWRDKDLDAVKAALDETGVVLNAIVVEPRCRLPDPATHEAFVQAVKDTIATAKRLGAKAIIPSIGPALPDVAKETQRASIVSALKKAAAIAEAEGMDLLIEPLNDKVDHPGMYLVSTVEGLDIVEAVGSPKLRLLWDMYHSATMGEVPETLFGDRAHLVAYVQAADSPGRNEPGAGAIDWPRYMKVVKALGYTGPMGLEYKPTGDTLASLKMARERVGA
jgi:hydroxypyruvate isomerase